MKKFCFHLGLITQVSLIYWCYAQLVDFPEEADIPPTRPVCAEDNSEICYALLQISGGVIIPQEPTDPGFTNFLYCGCENKDCNTKDWHTEPGTQLTFYHHERVDWKVQFKFCKRLPRKRLCEDDEEVAAVIRTSHERWKPRLVEYNCMCRDDLYVMKGWRYFDAKDGGELFDYWEYKFMCGRPKCEEKEACRRQYVDRSTLHTKAYEFYCSCSRGWYCPMGISPIKSYAQEGEDKEIGPYVHGYCAKIPGWIPGVVTTDEEKSEE